jgi:lipoate-protein ligase A
MALDETISRGCAEGGPPTLRFYAWTAPTLSIGRNQRLAESADLDACRSLGVELVRRPTGGAAVLHEHEVTYALSLPASEPLLGGGFRRALAALAEALAQGLRLAGVPAGRSTAAGNGAGGRRREPVCFFASAPDELMAEGAKVAGAAQWRFPGAVLQHGSIPLQIDPQRIERLTGWGRRGSRAGAAELAPGGVQRWLGARQEDSTGAPADLCASLIRALVEGFETVLNVRLDPGTLSHEEEAQARRLGRTLYGTEAWTRRL